MTQTILSIPLPLRPSPDKLIWIPNSKGRFLVKSAYLTTRASTYTPPNSGLNWVKLWNLNVLERIKIRLWKIGVNALPTRENLMLRLHIKDSNCVCCKQEVEMINHLFLRCPVSRVLWFSACWGLKTEHITSSQPSDIVKLLLDPPSGFETTYQKWQSSLIMALTMEEIWRSRNNLLHNFTSWDVALIHHRFHEYSSLHPVIITPLPEPPDQLWTTPPPLFNLDQA